MFIFFVVMLFVLRVFDVEGDVYVVIDVEGGEVFFCIVVFYFK